LRLRVEYCVGADLKFLSNLDLMRLLERALRRGRIPYALSEGFNPHIRLSMGTVLPVGLWGLKEYFDLDLAHAMPVEEFQHKLNQALPEAVRVNSAGEIESGSPALMKVINCTEYTFVLDDPGVNLEVWKNDLWQHQELTVASRGKKKGAIKDLRPGIYKIDVNQTAGFDIIQLWVSTGEALNIRFDELLDLLVRTGVKAGCWRDVFRGGNYIREDGRFYTPLEKVS